jgi:hypothetical protein
MFSIRTIVCFNHTNWTSSLHLLICVGVAKETVEFKEERNSNGAKEKRRKKTCSTQKQKQRSPNTRQQPLNPPPKLKGEKSLLCNKQTPLVLSARGIILISLPILSRLPTPRKQVYHGLNIYTAVTHLSPSLVSSPMIRSRNLQRSSASTCTEPQTEH